MAEDGAQYIGWWATRAGGRWHQVESDIADRVVMRCGRQMAMEHDYHGALSFMVSPDPAWPRCKQCVTKAD